LRPAVTVISLAKSEPGITVGLARIAATDNVNSFEIVFADLVVAEMSFCIRVIVF
jgi:hypothetical protein